MDDTIIYAIDTPSEVLEKQISKLNTLRSKTASLGAAVQLDSKHVKKKSVERKYDEAECLDEYDKKIYEYLCFECVSSSQALQELMQNDVESQDESLIRNDVTEMLKDDMPWEAELARLHNDNLEKETQLNELRNDLALKLTELKGMKTDSVKDVNEGKESGEMKQLRKLITNMEMTRKILTRLLVTMKYDWIKDPKSLAEHLPVIMKVNTVEDYTKR